MTDDRIVTATRVDEDAQYEAGLRPRVLGEYIGQDRVRENLQVSIAAARQRGEALDHVLLYGPPGLGKTTLAYVIAHELGTAVRATSGPVLEKPGDLAAILTNLQEREVLFIDEVHRMSPVIEEILYPAMEDYELDIMIGQGPSARSVKVPVQRFTLIGATTRTGLLTAPLRARFGIVHRLDFNGGPVGVASLAAAMSEERDAIEDIYEPFLIQIGFLDRTPRGRVATARAYEYFGLDAPGKDRLW